MLKSFVSSPKFLGLLRAVIGQLKKESWTKGRTLFSKLNSNSKLEAASLKMMVEIRHVIVVIERQYLI
jgi:hypothetical protein